MPGDIWTMNYKWNIRKDAKNLDTLTGRSGKIKFMTAEWNTALCRIKGE